MTRLPEVYDGNNALVMRFEYADAGMPFAMTTGSGTYFLAYDQVGSLRVVADGSGAVVKRIDYDSFGNVFNDSAPGFAVPFGFAGGLYDKDTKLVRFGYRDYDPDTGRWTAKDPIGFRGGDSDLYGYCVGDPVNFADPWGLLELKGSASYYDNRFEGRKTANGEIFHQDKMTGAMHFDKYGLKLPFDATVQSLDKDGNVKACVRVRVNDHGPFVSGSRGTKDRPGYVIDLSKSAYRALGGSIPGGGHLRVRVTVP